MSYSRFPGVYFYCTSHDPAPTFECCGCCLNGGETVFLDGYESAITHLEKHKPEDIDEGAIERLIWEREHAQSLLAINRPTKSG